MTDKVTLTSLASLENENTAINQINGNSVAIVTGFDNTLSRDGTSPNQMGAPLDMNSNQILNLPAPGTVNSPARLIDVTSNPSILVPPTGTSGATVPFLNGNNTWSGTDTFTNTVTAPNIVFTQIGTGATARTLDTKIKDYSVTPQDFGALGNGTNDDTTALQAALNAVLAAGGGTLFIPSGTYKITSGLTYNLSGTSSRFVGRLCIVGEGLATTNIVLSGVAAPAFLYTGSTSFFESYLKLEGLRFTGNKTVNSFGVKLVGPAGYVTIKECNFESFDYGLDMTDVEQSSFTNSNWKNNNQGLRMNNLTLASPPNGISLINCCISGNTVYGVSSSGLNFFEMLSGSIQGNGNNLGSSSCFGFGCFNSTTQASFQSVDFESTTGIADLYISQSAGTGFSYSVTNCNFARVNSLYSTNNICVVGTDTGNLRLSGSTFVSFGSYTPSGTRPCIALTNTSCSIVDNGTNVFQNSVEKIVYPATQIIPTVISQQINLQYPPILGGFVHAVNLNTANTDTAITITCPTTNYRIQQIIVILNTGTTASTATAGVFTATGGGGTAIVTNAALTTLTSSTVNTSGSLVFLTTINAYLNLTTLQFRVGTAEGAAATASVYIYIQPLP